MDKLTLAATRHPLRWNGRQSPSANVRRELPRMAARFFAQVREALAAPPDPAHLHRVRLETKRIRYTLELFRPCYGPALESRIESLRSLQQVLGEINDCDVSLRLLTSITRPSPARLKAQRFLAGRLRKKINELRERWQSQLGTPRQEALWIRYLSRGAIEPRSPVSRPATQRNSSVLSR